MVFIFTRKYSALRTLSVYILSAVFMTSCCLLVSGDWLEPLHIFFSPLWILICCFSLLHLGLLFCLRIQFKINVCRWVLCLTLYQPSMNQVSQHEMGKQEPLLSVQSVPIIRQKHICGFDKSSQALRKECVVENIAEFPSLVRTEASKRAPIPSVWLGQWPWNMERHPICFITLKLQW